MAKPKRPTKAEVEELLRVANYRNAALLQEMKAIPGVLCVCFQWSDFRRVCTLLWLMKYKNEPASALVDAAEDQVSLREKLIYHTQWQHQSLSELLQTANNGILILKVETK